MERKTRKKYMIKAINFGKKGELSRILVDKFLRANGQNKLSEMMRKLVVSHLSANPAFKDYKIDLLKQQRKEMARELADLSKRLCDNAENIEKQGGEID